MTHSNLNKNAFMSPPNTDEVSVNRLDYATPATIKKLGKIIEPRDNKMRHYSGIAILNVSEIKSARARIVYSPMFINNEKVKKFYNPYHSDIKIDYIKKKGEPLPQKYSYKISKMTEDCRFYLDPDPDSGDWKGEKLM